MMVKNFKVTRKVDSKAFVEQTWARLDAALDTIFSGGKVDFSLEELYRGVENLCRQGLARDTAERLEPKLQRGMERVFAGFGLVVCGVWGEGTGVWGCGFLEGRGAGVGDVEGEDGELVPG
jgi:hypothetical protein